MHKCIVCSDEVLIKSTTNVVAVRTTIVSFGHGCWFFGEKTCLVRLFALCRKILFNTSCHFKIGMHFILTLFYFSILVFGLFFFKLVFTVIVQGHISRGNYVAWIICWIPSKFCWQTCHKLLHCSTKVPPTTATRIISILNYYSIWSLLKLPIIVTLMILMTDISNDYGVWVFKWMIKGAFRSDYENILSSNYISNFVNCL
jgi:hypothetical protein